MTDDVGSRECASADPHHLHPHPLASRLRAPSSKLSKPQLPNLAPALTPTRPCAPHAPSSAAPASGRFLLPGAGDVACWCLLLLLLSLFVFWRFSSMHTRCTPSSSSRGSHSPSSPTWGINLLNTRTGYGQYARGGNAEIRERKAESKGDGHKKRAEQRREQHRAQGRASTPPTAGKLKAGNNLNPKRRGIAMSHRCWVHFARKWKGQVEWKIDNTSVISTQTKLSWLPARKWMQRSNRDVYGKTWHGFNPSY
jgi:hypothetical protein